MTPFSPMAKMKPRRRISAPVLLFITTTTVLSQEISPSDSLLLQTHSSCTNTLDYQDIYGNGCAYYESDENHPILCLSYGGNGAAGLTPNENCCACKRNRVLSSLHEYIEQYPTHTSNDPSNHDSIKQYLTRTYDDPVIPSSDNPAVINIYHSLTRQYGPDTPSDTCYDNFYQSDEDGDGMLGEDEYLTFILDLSGNQFEVEEYADLPFGLKVNFMYLSCLCTSSDQINEERSRLCCQGGIDVPIKDGMKNASILQEDSYFRTVCTDTEGAIEYEKSQMIIPEPIVTPTPTAEPTSPPTVSPTSKAPTATPTANPTVFDAKASGSAGALTPDDVPASEYPDVATEQTTGIMVANNNPDQTPGATVSTANAPNDARSIEEDTESKNESEEVAPETAVVISIIVAAVVVVSAGMYLLSRKRDINQFQAPFIDDKDVEKDLEAQQEERDLENQWEQEDLLPFGKRSPSNASSDSSAFANNTVQNTTKSLSSSSNEDSPLVVMQPVTRKSLSAAIEAGDWAAVGVMAAQFANSSHSTPIDESLMKSGLGQSTSYIDTRESSNVSNATVDDTAISAFNSMVSAGDWEKVILAAARSEGWQEHDDGDEGSESGRPLGQQELSLGKRSPSNARSDSSAFADNTAQNTTKSLSSSSNEDSPLGVMQPVTRDSLSTAIEAGDWATVGVMAAQFANSSHIDESLMKSGSGQSTSYIDTRESSNVSNATEDDTSISAFNGIVSAGDWEKVILAAARSEGWQEHDDGDEGSESGQPLGQQESQSQPEVSRENIKALVERVSPEDIGNVDEMMLHFMGREGVLIETLQKMEDRMASQRMQAISNAVGSPESSSSNFGMSSRETIHLSYDLPIEDEWQDVGQSIDSDSSGTSINHPSEADRSSILSDATGDSATSPAMDQTVDNGIWEGIVSAAARSLGWQGS